MLAHNFSPRQTTRSSNKFYSIQLITAIIFITLLVTTICIVFAELSPLLLNNNSPNDTLYSQSYILPHLTNLYTQNNFTGHQQSSNPILIDTTQQQSPCVSVDSRTHQPIQCRNRQHKCFYNFPRYTSYNNTVSIPTNNLYITSVPDHGAGIGHQFGEWLYAPYLSYQYNISYMFTPFIYNSARWTKFLGWSEGEDTEDDLLQMTRYESYKKVTLQYNSVFIDKVVPEVWLDSALHEIQSKFHTGEYTAQDTIVIELNRIHVPQHNMSCQPDLNLLLRQKYCLARVRRPVAVLVVCL